MEAFVRRYWLFWLFTAIGLLFFSYHYLDDLARQQAGTAGSRFVEEMTGAYSAFVLVPFVIALSRRFPFTASTWSIAVLAQIGGFVGYSVIHTSLMGLSRLLIFPLVGLGPYDYGLMGYRYPMEASHDAIIYPVVVIIIYFADRLSAARRAELAAARLQAELAQAKLDNLRLQLHPHFLFNTLNAISSVMYEDVRKADVMIVRLSDFLRVILSSTDAPEIPFDEELQIEGMYFNIMRARLESKLNLRLEVGKEAEKAMVPSLILQPLIENAIEHGMGSSREALDINIAAQRTDGTINISISDNGVGFAPVDRTASGHGKGIANVKSRLTHLYGDAFAFDIGNNDQGGTAVTMTFPYRVA